jgi:hypothetical protein
MNKACIMKLGWKLQQDGNDLWSRVLLGKYGRGVSNLANAIAKPPDSCLWKTLVSVMPWIEANMCKAIGDGHGTKAWESCWIARGLRVNELDVVIPPSLENASVADLVANDGGWNWNNISWLPENVLNMIAAIPAPVADIGKDTIFWPSENHGQFTVSSAYDLLMKYEPCDDEKMWRMIWKLQVPERVKCYIWLLKHGRVLTNLRLSKMHRGSPFCSSCGDIIETELHVLRDCAQCMNIWLAVVKDSTRAKFFNSNLQQWIGSNLNGEIQGEGVENWPSFWAHACHSLWFWRNKEAHVDNFFRPSDPTQVIKKKVNDYLLACKTDYIIHCIPRVIQHVGWSPPSDGWVALNTDGAENSEHKYGCGGLIRGSSGEWLGGFAKGLGDCSIE